MSMIVATFHGRQIHSPPPPPDSRGNPQLEVEVTLGRQYVAPGSRASGASPAFTKHGRLRDGDKREILVRACFETAVAHITRRRQRVPLAWIALDPRLAGDQG